mmetsp:Transcript_54129/g.154174  ORF Transcript_54129/g.154174 Transcript_54129/m.154174 type:complete len:306 (-) Transcript_54129:972-1889(-)
MPHGVRDGPLLDERGRQDARGGAGCAGHLRGAQGQPGQGHGALRHGPRPREDQRLGDGRPEGRSGPEGLRGGRQEVLRGRGSAHDGHLEDVERQREEGRAAGRAGGRALQAAREGQAGRGRVDVHCLRGHDGGQEREGRAEGGQGRAGQVCGRWREEGAGHDAGGHDGRAPGLGRAGEGREDRGPRQAARGGARRQALRVAAAPRGLGGPDPEQGQGRGRRGSGEGPGHRPGGQRPAPGRARAARAGDVLHVREERLQGGPEGGHGRRGRGPAGRRQAGRGPGIHAGGHVPQPHGRDLESLDRLQ